MTETKGFSATVAAVPLLSALSKVALVIERRNTIPIIGCFRLDAHKGSLRITGTNLDTEVRDQIAVDEAFGSACLPAEPLLRFLRACGPDAEDRAEFTTTDGRVKVSLGAASLVLFSLPVADYPTFPAHELAEAVDLPAGSIPHLLGTVAQSISTEETRYYLNGVCLEFEESSIRATATNGHMLSSVAQALSRAVPINSKVILPRHVLPILSKIVARDQCIMSFLRSDEGGIKSIRFEIGDCTINAKLIDGTFPDWRRVLPTNLPKAASFQLPVFMKAIGIAKSGASERGRASKLAFDGKQLRIMVKNPDTGDTEARIECDGVDGFEIGFNSVYLESLLGAVKRAGSKSVRLLMDDPGAPAKIVGDDDAYGFHVIMPMRI